MQAAYITISVIIIIASILLTLVVLVQNSKGGGLAANFASGNQTFGVRQTADFLEKLTWGLAAVIIVLCIIATFVVPEKNVKYPQTNIEMAVPEQTSFPEATLPAAGEAAPAAETPEK